MVVLHALGQALIRTAVGTITPRAHNGFSLAMYLIAERGRRIPRESLLALFWPGGGCRAATAHALSVALHKLRCRGLPVATDYAQFVWLPREAAIIDVDMLTVDPLHVLLERDLSVLPGYTATGSPAFHDWVDEWRHTMEARVFEQLVDAMNRAARDGEWRTALGLAGYVLRDDRNHRDALWVTARAAHQLHRERTGARAQLPGAERTAAISEPSTDAAWGLPISGFAASRDTPLVGRDREIGILCNALDDTARIRGSSIFVSGAAGMGKSRLLREAMTESRMRRMSVAFTSCQEYDRHRPLSAFVDLVPELRALPGAAGVDPVLISALDRLTGQEAPPSKARRNSVDADFVFDQLRRGLFDLLDAVSHEQPLFLIIENVQWLDAASWSLLRAIMTWSSTRSLAMALTSREPWDVEAHGLPPTNVRVRPLSPLDAESIRAHARDYAATIGHKPPPALVEWCTSASEGNPYLVEELLNHWVATGEQFQAPPSLALLLDTRLTRLAPTSLHVLQACAVLGKNSTIPRVEYVLGETDHALFAALEELGHAGMLNTARDAADGGDGPVLCRHDALAQAAIKRLSAAGRELLHRRTGMVLEAELDAGASAALLWDCAGHWFEAGQSRRAVELGLSCAAHLLDVGLARAAADGCEKTLCYCVLPSDREAVLRAYALALYLDRRWDDLRDAIAQIRAIAPRTTQSPHDDLELWTLDAGLHGYHDWASVLSTSISCATTVDADAHHRVHAGIVALKIATNLADANTMERVFAGVRACLDSPTITAVDRAIAEMIYHAICGDLAVAADRARFLLSDPDADETSELHRLSRTINCAATLFRAGYLEEADALYARVVERACALGATAIASDACARSFSMHLDVGEMERASAWIRRYMSLRPRNVQPAPERRLRLALARLETWQENYGSAEHLLDPKEGPLWNDGVVNYRAAALATKIRLEIAGEKVTQLEFYITRLQEASQRLRPMGVQDFETFSLYLGLRHVGKHDEALALLTDYISRDRRDPFPPTPEIQAECARVGIPLTGLPRASVAELPAYAEASDAKST